MTNSPPAQFSNQQPIKIAVVGDVHDLWEPDDALALKHLGVDLVLLVGDFGNESVDVVSAIAALELPKAVILGNHDAWYSASEWGRKKSPYDRTREDRVQQQIDLLGTCHVGYGYLDFPDLQLSVVGSRPFSWGGQEWKNAEFYRDRYGIASFDDSTTRIVAASEKAAYNTIIFLGHNGPLGLGDRACDPCGKDWRPMGGDYGDRDLAEAITQTRSLGKTVSLVAFGHMHHELNYCNQTRVAIAASPEGTVYLNAACVPRIVETDSGKIRNFSLVNLQAGRVTDISLVWLDRNFDIVSAQELHRQPVPATSS